MSVTIDFVYPNLKAVELLEKNLKNATITVLCPLSLKMTDNSHRK